MDIKALKALYDSAADKRYNRARWVSLQEGRVLYDAVKEEEPECIFESGTANGFSTLWLALCDIPVVTFDPIFRLKLWDEMEGGCLENITCVSEEFSSSDMLERAQAVEGKKLFFIDGDHESTGLLKDTEAVKKVVSPGDVIIFHDLNIASVFRAWHRMTDFASSYENITTKRLMGKMTWGEKP